MHTQKSPAVFKYDTALILSTYDTKKNSIIAKLTSTQQPTLDADNFLTGDLLTYHEEAQNARENAHISLPFLSRHALVPSRTGSENV